MFRVFYSWASDDPIKDNRFKVIYPALTNAVTALGKANGFEKDIKQCDRFRGATPIVEYIRDTLSQCHAHVVDVSFINDPDETRTRRTPNPNNMFEFGLSLDRLGAKNIVLLFDKQSGDLDDLPFDLQHLAVVSFDSQSPNVSQRLEKELQSSLKGSVQDYKSLVSDLCRDIDRSLKQLLPFFDQFLSEHEADPHVRKLSLDILGPTPNTNTHPDKNYLASLLKLFHKNALRLHSRSCEGEQRPWGAYFEIMLQRLHNDCKRIAYRYEHLKSSRLHNHVTTLGHEAEHAMNLFKRVLSDVPDMIVDEMITEDLDAFLQKFIDARKEVACLQSSG